MHPPRGGIDQLGQGIDIRPLELGNLPMFKDLARQTGAGMIEGGQLFQRFLIGAGGPGDPRLALRRQFEFLEQHLAQLHQRVNGERVAGQGIDLCFDLAELLLHLLAELTQPGISMRMPLASSSTRTSISGISSSS